MRWFLRLALLVGAGALLVSASVAAVAPRLWRIANAHEEIPVELPDFGELSQRSRIFDASGTEIASFELENSQPISLGDVPDHVIDAFLAVEDSEFYLHHGVDVRSLFRATLSSFAEGSTGGASTITMQVVKNDYLAGLERDGRYKLLQIAYAVRLEKERTKDEILERYLNTVFFGQNAYGVSAAAETYFAKRVDELTFIEAAFLAGLVQAPSTYDPVINPERSRTRFIQVLNRLVTEDFLTVGERDFAEATFVLPERSRRRDDRQNERTYFTEVLRDYLLNRSDLLGETYQERYTRLHRGGLQIHTTLDPTIQARAEEARDVLPANAAGIDAAMTSIENSTGAVRAMVGGEGFVPGENEVNLAMAPSQTGSSVKFFILAAALQAGATPEDVINGEAGCRLPSGDPREPTFTVSGGVNGGTNTLRHQTTISGNCGFLRLAHIVGLNRVVDTIYRMARSPYLYRGQPVEDRRPLEPFPNLAIGSNELSSFDMAAGMQTIANIGEHLEPYFIEYIDDAFGERVYTHQLNPERVLDRAVALEAIDVLRGPPRSGTARRELSDLASRRPIIGKTGTQDSNTVSYYVGATPDLTTAVIVRDPDRYTEMRNIPEFAEAGVSRVQGGTFPAQIWGAFTENVGLEQALGDWPEPEEAPRGPAKLYLPGMECVYVLAGYQTVEAPTPSPEATQEITSEGRTVGQEPPPSAPPGTAPPAPVVQVPIYNRVPGGTTVPPDELDPSAPLPSVAANRSVGSC